MICVLRLVQVLKFTVIWLFFKFCLAQKVGFVPKGADSGDALNLAQFIIDNYSSRNFAYEFFKYICIEIVLPIFYPAAQAHRDVIPKALENQGFFNFD